MIESAAMNRTPLTDRQKEILHRLEELSKEQKPLIRGMSPEEATANPISLAELEAYGERADEINALTHELIESVKAEGPVTGRSEAPNKGKSKDPRG